MDKVPDWILVGIVGRPHGTGGEVLVKLHTEHAERFNAGARLFLADRDGEGRHEKAVVSSRMTAKGLMLKIEGCSTREQAKELVGSLLFIRGSEIAPPEAGSYYDFQLEGCDVIAGTEQIGVVISLMQTVANPVLEVRPEGGGAAVLIPLVSDVILSVDLDLRRITIPEGFLG